MHYRIFSLQPGIFESFFSTSLIARGLDKGIITKEIINWREKFGIGGYRQVDDRPYGGGSGMVLMAEPIFKALEAYQAVSTLFVDYEVEREYDTIVPNNSIFYNKVLASGVKASVTISLTPKGFPINQRVVEWLSGFETLNILCGRYEGFDSRVSGCVDLELSLGNFVTNGGEVPAMALIEAVSRLLPGFVVKKDSIRHDSFSSGLNQYQEMKEFVIGKRKLEQNNLNMRFEKTTEFDRAIEEGNTQNLFDDELWKKNVLPYIEHPQFTRPVVWRNRGVPQLLIRGDHKLIQKWRSEKRIV